MSDRILCTIIAKNYVAFARTLAQSFLSQYSDGKVYVLIVDDFEGHKYVAAYGRAEIIEQNVGELARPIIEKYVPADRLEQSVKMVGNDPTRVLVVLQPEKIVTN